MAPPQQAGKFKPRRKPKKIIRPGAAVDAAAASGTGTSTASGNSSNPSSNTHEGAAPPAVGSSVVAPGGGGRGRSRSNSRGRGGRSGGRGGRDGRGRGRGRIPIQQGTAFFTAAPAPTKKTSRASSSSSRASAAVARRQANDRKLPTRSGAQDEEIVQQEEIVGMMDETIGEPLPEPIKSTKASRALTTEGQGTSEMDVMEEPKVPEDENQFTYDSDSSRESRRSTTGVFAGGPFVPDDEPIRLPFPPSSTPIGIGNKALHPSLSQNQTDEPIAPIPASTISNGSQAVSTEQNRPSPFVDMSELPAFQQEKDSWFLMQFPTRLPPLNKAYNQDGKIKAEDAMEDTDDRNHAAEHNSKIETAEVSTSPVKFDQFDNAMVTAVPGKMGRIQIHKSGKTYLLLQAKDGTEMRLKLSEGLGCTFQQQAAVIDVENANFVQLGKIGKTVVATPDLQSS